MEDRKNKVSNLISLHRKNNFDLLRLIAAFGVLVSHSYGILNKGLEQPMLLYGNSRIILSDIGLFIFFTISGFLVTQSLLRSISIIHYLRKRFMRIWPGLVVVNIFCFTMGGFVSGFSWKEYLSNASPWLYVVKNSSLVVIEYHIEGVFTNLRNTAVNASLWTILMEIKFYLLLSVMRFHSLFTNRILLLAGFILLCVARGLYISMADKNSIVDTYLLFGSYFYLGSILHFLKAFHQFKWLYAVVLWVLFFIMPQQAIKEILLTISIGYTVVMFGNTKQLIDLKGNDISYGFYLYAFPVQQLVLLFGGYHTPVWMHVLYSTIITVPLAWASWHIVEKRFLQRKSLTNKEPST